jgi:PAS domain-containing protein
MRSITDGVIAVDTYERITMMNLVAEELTGWKQTEAVGKRLCRVFTLIPEKEEMSSRRKGGLSIIETAGNKADIVPAVLPKPYSVREMGEVVRAALADDECIAGRPEACAP